MAKNSKQIAIFNIDTGEEEKVSDLDAEYKAYLAEQVKNGKNIHVTFPKEWDAKQIAEHIRKLGKLVKDAKAKQKL